RRPCLPTGIIVRIAPLFSYPCSGAHHDLHSCPTRRSSDLIASIMDEIAGKVQFGVGKSSGENRDHPIFEDTDWDVYKDIPISILDRKSTRLNSSHVSISYAVFCLTQKKRHMRQQMSAASRT